MMKSHYKAQGFLKEQRVFAKSTPVGSELRSIRGYLLDELQVEATLTSKNDVENLMLFLQTVMNSFEK